jgi:hypothetical protein
MDLLQAVSWIVQDKLIFKPNIILVTITGEGLLGLADLQALTAVNCSFLNIFKHSGNHFYHVI